MISLKRENLFIHKEEKRHETPPDAVVDLSILLLLNCKPWTIKAMTAWLRQFNAVTYYRWTLGATTIPDYWIVADTLSMLEYN